MVDWSKKKLTISTSNTICGIKKFCLFKQKKKKWQNYLFDFDNKNLWQSNFAGNKEKS